MPSTPQPPLPSSPHLQPGTILTLTIERVVFGGDGLARHEGMVVFIPFVCPGEIVRAEIWQVKKGFARADLMEVLQPSPERVTPFCPHFTRCGGCAYQHASIPAQRAWKKAQFHEMLRRAVSVTVDIPPILGGSQTEHYRNRITVQIRDGIIGFHQHGKAGALVPINRCPLASDAVNRALTRLLAAAPPADGHRTLREPGQGRYFSQVNPEMAGQLLLEVRKAAGSGIACVDLYAGDGFFARALADDFTHLLAVERSPAALAAGEAIARTDRLPVEFLHGDAETVPLTPWLDQHVPATHGVRAGLVMILDPPRTGLGSDMPRLLGHYAPERLLYVSCDPATLCRDLARLQPHFSIEQIRLLDLFPHTAEFEIVVTLHHRPTG